MMMVVTRDLYNHVTYIPVLYPCEPDEAEGWANFDPFPFFPVRTFGEDDLKASSGILNSLNPSAKAFLEGVVGLKYAHEASDPVAMERAYEKLAHIDFCAGAGEPEDLQVAKKFARLVSRKPDSATFYLPQWVTQTIKSARLVLWWDELRKQLTPAVFCPNKSVALFVRVLFSFGGSRLRLCPRCEKPFLGRPNKNYCSLRCREAHRVARWRAQKKLEDAGKGLRQGRQSTRRRRRMAREANRKKR